MYIEFVIADNFLLTYLAGLAGYRLGRNKPIVWRLVVASVIGTAVAVLYPFLPCYIWLQTLVKLCLWIVLGIIMYAKIPRAFVMSLMFLGCTFAFGGASYALGLIVRGSGTGAEMFAKKYPLFVVLGCAAAVYVCIKTCIKRMRLPTVRAPYEFGTEIEAFGAKMKFAAFLDTGNCVFDGKSGLPVVITDMDRFTEKLDGGGAVMFARAVPKLRSMTVTTPAGRTKIYVVEPTRITVYSGASEHKISAMVGLVRGGDQRFSDEHELLLNPAAFSEGV